MAELTALDSLAAVRFASVFRNFQSTDDYAEFFESVESKREAGSETGGGRPPLRLEGAPPEDAGPDDEASG
jgi:hypothetical protein